ncbi:MAG: class I SAM-dependent methyltransferase [Luteimonas sp.]
MPGYQTLQHRIHLGGHAFHIRALSNLQQFADPDHRAERAGISSAQWSLFGQIWPAGVVLADAMGDQDIAGKRILELGCGLGLSSLLLRWRGADVVATDYHPLAEPFLAYNSALNGLPSVPYRELRWDEPQDTLGIFDLVIGSDVLYERAHGGLIATLIAAHTHAASEVLIADPGRGNSAPFTRALRAQGFAVNEQRMRISERDVLPFRGRLLRYSRAIGSATAAVGGRA